MLGFPVLRSLSKLVKKKTETKVIESLSDIIDALNEKFGEGTLTRLTEETPIKKIECISTGSINTDLAISGRFGDGDNSGGFPRGRIVEIFGGESSGKTTMALQTVAEAQKMGVTCSFVDAEHALDLEYAADLGVDLESLLLNQPDNGEQALDIVDSLASTGKVGVIVVDSVAALVPKSEIEGDMGDPTMGKHARLMSQAMRKLTHSLSANNCLCIFINQTRDKIGQLFGPKKTTTGGNALKFYASVRVDLARTGALKDGEESVGNRTRAKIVKNKIYPPYKQAEFDIVYGKGVHRASELLELCTELGFVDKSGHWYSYNNEKLGNGKQNAVQSIESNQELQKILLNDITNHFNTGRST